MNLINLSKSIINEIQGMRQDFKLGKITTEQYAAQLGGISQIEKQQNLILKTTIIEERLKRKLTGGYVALENPKEEKIKCPCQKNKKITREECLDYSGDSKNFEKCQKCDEFSATRNLFLPQN